MVFTLLYIFLYLLYLLYLFLYLYIYISCTASSFRYKMKAQEEALEHIRHMIKIWPNRGHIFQKINTEYVDGHIEHINTSTAP